MGSLPSETYVRAKRVCIVGAGPSGLAAAKYLLAENAFETVVVYEQSARVGGIWNYKPCPDDVATDLSIPQTNPHAGLDTPVWDASKVLGTDGEEKASFTTPLYDRLETNIPRDLMGFSDLDWPEACQLFPRHEDVMEYLNEYAKDVRRIIQFDTQVLEVRQLDDGRWSVQTQKIQRNPSESPQEHIFDAVVVANGHYNVPYIPSVPGIEAWNKAHPGIIAHSKFYRLPENYTGKKVVVVGNSASGIDIGAQIASVATTMIQSQKSESYLGSVSASNRREKPEIVEYIPQDRSVRFADGSIELNIDAILYCTGYFYSYPFLDSLGLPVVTTGERVENTYQHIFYRPNPSLAFLVLNQKVIPFPLAEVQSAVIARVFSGRLSLPDQETMEAWEESIVAQEGDAKAFHVLKFPKDADYINMLHDWAVSVDGKEGKAGKKPPHWDEKQYWIRERFPAIKKAFQDCGEERRNRRRLEDVGYDFEKWKVEAAEEHKLLQ